MSRVAKSAAASRSRPAPARSSRSPDAATLSATTAHPAVSRAASSRSLHSTKPTWVLLTEAPDGGWGLSGHADTKAELVSAARAQIAAASNPST
ncbi:MAG: hypothetical protein ABI301_05190 [Jatrophihabitantaceae bacterium]